MRTSWQPWLAVLRAWLHRLLGLGSVVPFDFCSWCRYLLELVILLRPAAVPGVLGFSSVRWIPTLAGVVVARPAVGPTDGRRSVTGGGLLHLCFLLVVRRSTTGLPRVFEVMDPVFFCSLLHWRRLSVVLPLLRLTAVSLAFGLAFAVFCGSCRFPRGY